MREADKSCPASEKCQQEKRKTVNGEDILFAMTSLGFENYGEALKIYLARYREVSLHHTKFRKDAHTNCREESSAEGRATSSGRKHRRSRQQLFRLRQRY